MTWKSAWQRAADTYAEGERRRQSRLNAPTVPQWSDPFADTRPAYGGSTMNGQQDTAPTYKDAYTRACESLAEMDQRRLARASGEPLPAPSMETARALAARLVDPNRPQPEFPPDPRISESTRILAARALGTPPPSASPGASGADSQE